MTDTEIDLSPERTAELATAVLDRVGEAVVGKRTQLELVLADEINRTPPKTQSALLEAMAERQVTVEGRTFALPDPFCVLATANPRVRAGFSPVYEAPMG